MIIRFFLGMLVGYAKYENGSNKKCFEMSQWEDRILVRNNAHAVHLGTAYLLDVPGVAVVAAEELHGAVAGVDSEGPCFGFYFGDFDVFHL